MNNRGIMSNAEWRSPLGRFIRFFYLIILLIVSVLVIFPFIFSFTAGLHNSIDVVKPGIHLWPKTPLWGNYLDAWQRFKISRLFLNTAIAAGGGVIAQLLVSSLAAYSLSRLNPIGKNIIRAVILITMPGIGPVSGLTTNRRMAAWVRVASICEDVASGPSITLTGSPGIRWISRKTTVTTTASTGTIASSRRRR